MKTFNMYVKTVIYNEQNKLLLLKEKRDDKKNRWDLPGATFTEEQSFDETVITNVQKEIGYYVYPGKIIGIADYTNKTDKEVHVIMEGNILNGELLLSKEYETYNWIKLDRIKDYPLVPWLHNYIHNNKHPFEDVETEIEELTNKRQRRREIIQEDLMNSIHSKNKTEKINGGVSSSFSLLKDTIKKTFHPREAQVTQTTPKTSEIYQEPEEPKENKKISEKLNFRFKHKPEEEYVDKSVLESNEGDIIIEHDTENINSNDENTDIIIEHDEEVPDEIIPETYVENKSDEKIDIKVDKQENSTNNEPEIKVIRKTDKTPLIRTEKESKEKVSFNSENISRWKEKLNRINRTDANDEKKNIPRPKGQRK
ncbi:MAG: NUDIX domain-containing protein [Methanosphaera sp.]|nr:NUDIX domain-containing protein [Methanosphaera sp.]